MTDISIRIIGQTGRITLQRPQALNAMTYEMCLAIEAALDDWRADPAVKLVVMDAQGDRAFCSGGDIADMYATGTAGDFAYGQKFWADEYRLNAKIFEYPKPVVSFLQGFTMGGGVGIGCHGSHRIVGDTSQIAMPEVGIGLVPDVGGTLMLALAPERLGEYLGTTASRMNASDAIFAGFADIYIPEGKWSDLIAQLETTGDTACLVPETPAEIGPIQSQMPEITKHFRGVGLSDVLTTLENDDSEFAQKTLKQLRRNSSLSMACTFEILNRLRGSNISLAKALDLEYRFTARSMEHGDFIEGIRAAIIDKDRSPKWQFADGTVPATAVSKMLLPLGQNALNLQTDTSEGHGMNIGFIGLGNMGAPMAANLAAAGHNVTGFDPAGTTAEGVSVAATSVEAATGADVVITMLPNGAILRSVAAEVIPAMESGATLLDCSTVDVESASAVAADAQAAGLFAADAPVSGGQAGAENGQLSIMCGGDQSDYDWAEPVMNVYAKLCRRIGDTGAGQMAKMCNQIAIAGLVQGLSEALHFASKAGLDGTAVVEVISQGAAGSWQMSNRYETMLADHFEHGFAVDWMRKDLGICLDAANENGASLPVTALVDQFYKDVQKMGGGRWDTSALFKRLQEN